MKIVNRKKFVKSVIILLIILYVILTFAKNTYSKVDIKYKEDYIYAGDTLWTIAKQESIYNKYFENKDIREIVNELKDINNLQDSNLIEGDKIKIPIYR